MTLLPYGIEQFIPFFFILAVTYGSLEVSKMFESKGVKSIISLVLALFAMIVPGLSAFVLAIMPYAIGIFVVFFFIGFVMSFFKGDEKKGEKKDLALPVIIAGLVMIFLASQGDTVTRWFPSMGFLSDENFLVAMILVVIMLVLYAAYKTKSS